MPIALITGFGPFPGVPINLSAELVGSLPTHMSGFEIVRAVLDTCYASAASLSQILCDLRPDVVLCTGIARTGGLRLETVAYNAIESTLPNAEGEQPIGPIVQDGPSFYPTSLPVSAITKAARDSLVISSSTPPAM